MVRKGIVRSVADYADRLDAGSVLSREELVAVIRYRLKALTYRQRQDAYDAWETDNVSRRDFLKALGVVGAGGVATLVGGRVLIDSDEVARITGRQAAQPSASDSADEVVVPSGGTELFEVGEGETLANKLIDITADGASFRIRARGTGWTIKNIGVRGKHPLKGNTSWSEDKPIIIGNDTGDGTSRMGNCYFGDGGVWNGNWQDQAALFLTTGSHSGKLIVQNVNCQGWQNNAIYSNYQGQGAGGGAGGMVHVKDSYFKDNAVASVRLGSDGSTAENCVIVGGPHRGFWTYWENATFTNCHATMPDGRCFEAGGGAYPHMDTAQMELENCQATGARRTRARGGATIVGTPGNDPRTEPPQGVPMTAEEAACIE